MNIRFMLKYYSPMAMDEILISLTYENRMRRGWEFHPLLSQFPLDLICNLQIKIKKDGEIKLERMATVINHK